MLRDERKQQMTQRWWMGRAPGGVIRSLVFVVTCSSLELLLSRPAAIDS